MSACIGHLLMSVKIASLSSALAARTMIEPVGRRAEPLIVRATN
jgi:hypothetical protein